MTAKQELKKVMNYSKEMCKRLKSSYIGTEHFICSVLYNCERYRDIFDTMEGNCFEGEIISVVGIGTSTNGTDIMTPKMKMLYEDSDSVDMMMYKIFIIEKEGTAYRIMRGNYNENDFQEIENKIIKLFKGDKFNGKMPSYLVDLSNQDYVTNPAIGRDIIMEEVEKTLLKMNKPNVLLIGEAGVGKTAIVEGIAYRIKNNLSNERLKDLKLLSVSSSCLVAGTRYRGDFEKRVEELCEFLKLNSNIVLFIDEMHTTVKAGASDGAISMADILKPYLARGEIKVIGATTLKESEIISEDSAYKRRFTVIKVEEPTMTNVNKIVEESLPKFERFYDIKIDKRLVSVIVNESKYLQGKFPDKCIDLLENVCCDTIYNNEKKFNKKDIQRVAESIQESTGQLELV